MPDPGTCRSCREPIVWVRTTRGAPMPLDAALVTIVTDDGVTVRGRISHFATCPQSAAHRKPKPAAPAAPPPNAVLPDEASPWPCDIEGCHEEPIGDPLARDRRCATHAGADAFSRIRSRIQLARTSSGSLGALCNDIEAIIAGARGRARP